MSGNGTAPAAEVLVIGAGPAALAIIAALAEEGVAVQALAAADPEAPWVNTYGIWADEVEALGLASLLEHRWSRTLSWFGPEPTFHGREYGLFHKQKLQHHWLGVAERAGVVWHRGSAARLVHHVDGSTVSTAEGQQLQARLVVDASGHQPVFVNRRLDGPVAGQAAYGIVGRFSAPPIEPGQFVFMDYRPDHLRPEELAEPPTFLYAMDLGDGLFFVEETSLALAPAVPFPTLRDRLHRRLAHRGVRVEEIQHEEFCLFPMNPPLPDLGQRVVGFGGAAGRVHPASGYMVGGLLRRAPGLAAAIAAGLQDPALSAEGLAAAAWETLWPPELRWKHSFFRFGLEKLMRFEEARLRHHFGAFFQLPSEQWYGFLTNTLPVPALLQAMLGLFATAPNDVRAGLMLPQGRELALMARLLTLP
ncbi:MAG: lycopene beta cyclase [Cyanobacteriota bacterium]